MTNSFLAGALVGMIVGMLVLSLVDRIRGVRIVRDVTKPPKERKRVPDASPTRPRAAPQGAARDLAQGELHDARNQRDVIAALVDAGYSRDIAMRAAGACPTHDRATIETWTSSALRRALSI